MGWYAGQEGAARLRWHEQSRAAYNRFCSSTRNAMRTSFYDRVEDNNDRQISTMMVRNPMSQEDLVKEILDAAPTGNTSASSPGNNDGSSGGWVVAIAASDNLTDLSLLNGVAEHITGLFLYGCHECDRTKMEAFFSRLVNLESLTLGNCCQMMQPAGQGVFLKGVFARGMLPKLKFLETDEATDDAIAEMSTAPNLATMVFSYPSARITNDGIQRLVDAGGGKELMKISAGVLKKHLSKSITKKYVSATLPKLIAMNEYQAHEHLTHMAKGSKKKSAHERLLEKHKVEDSKPFAVIPPERMNHGQLVEALKRRGVSVLGGKKRPTAVELRAMFVDGKVQWSYEQELAHQNKLKLEHLKEQKQRLARHAGEADHEVDKLTSGKFGQNKGKLYPLFCAYEIESALRQTNVCIPRDASKRRDDRAKLLHDSGYQGGGTVEEQIVHYRNVSVERHALVAEKEGEIQMLRQQMALKSVGDINHASAGNANAGSKRNFQLMS